MDLKLLAIDPAYWAVIGAFPDATHYVGNTLCSMPHNFETWTRPFGTPLGRSRRFAGPGNAIYELEKVNKNLFNSNSVIIEKPTSRLDTPGKILDLEKLSRNAGYWDSVAAEGAEYFVSMNCHNTPVAWEYRREGIRHVCGHGIKIPMDLSTYDNYHVIKKPI